MSRERRSAIRVAVAFVFMSFFLFGFATRVMDYHIPDFEIGAAAGWLNVDDGRSFPLKGTYTVNKFGYNFAVDGTEESIWDTPDLGGPLRCFGVPSAASFMMISSSDAADATKGVTIELLDSSYKKWIVPMTLGAASAGTGTVFKAIGGTIDGVAYPTVTWLRVNRAYATSTALVGDVYIHLDPTDIAVADGIPDTPLTDTVAVITAGENQTLQACYTVPAGFSALMTNWCSSNITTAAGNDVTLRLRKSVEGAATRNQGMFSLADGSSQCSAVNPPVLYTEKTDIEFTAIDDGGAGTQSASGMFGLLLIPNGS